MRTSIKLLKSCCVCLFLLASNSFAITPNSIALVKNLNGIDYAGKTQVTNAINKIFNDADAHDAYSMSLPLIAAAQQGERKPYKDTLKAINIPLKGMPEDVFKGWILGRILLAADSIGDTNTVTDVKLELQNIIDNFDGQNYEDINYAFYAWACAYLAALNNDEYAVMQQRMITSAQNLSSAYMQAGTHDALSNAVWAWVMDLQAAVNAQDANTCQYILNQITTLTAEPSVKQALATSLIRTDTSSDYPAWAIGIVELSAATMQDKSLYQDLKKSLALSIKQAKAWGQSSQSTSNQWKAKAEAILGRLNEVLAKVRFEATDKK